jgi:hypothetical protein
LQYQNDDIRPENGDELPEVVEPVVVHDEIPRHRFSRMDCRCCGCSGTVVLFVLLAVVSLAVYYIFFR